VSIRLVVEFRHSSIFSRLRGLLDVTRLVRNESDLPTLLDEIARTVSESLGFGTVVVNLYRPAWDAFQITAVHGSAEARDTLLGETRGVEAWTPLLAPEYETRGAYLIPQGEFDWSDGTLARYVPPVVRNESQDAWLPEDTLLVPLRHTDGHLLGIVSVDEPVSGRRPGSDELDVLVAVAEHAALAIQSAQEAARSERHRAALERLLAVSSSLNETRPVEDTLQIVCEAIQGALGFGTVSVELLDPASDTYLTRARIGRESEGDAVVPLDRAEVESLLDPAFEIEGCFLLPDDEARTRLGAARATYRSHMNGSGPHAWNHHWLIVPLTARGARIGFLWADDPSDRMLPTRERLQTLRAFANHAGTALDAAAGFAAIHEANTRHQGLIDSAPLAIVDIDATGAVLTWNPAAERIFGWTAEEVIGAAPLWVPEEHLPEYELLRERSLHGEAIDGVELERRRKDGTRIDIALWTTPLRDPNEEIVGATSIIREVTERKRAERALVASEARTAAILQAALDAVITLDHEGRVVDFNPAAEETFGWTSGEATGRDFLELAVPPRFRGGFAQTLSAGSGPLLGTRLEIEALRSDGREFSAEILLSRVAVEGPPLYAASLRDITRRKAQDDQLRETAAKYRALVEGLPLATYVNELGLPVRTTWMSPQIEQMLGYLPEEWLAEGFFEQRIHPDDRERVLAEVGRTHATGEPFRAEYRMLARDSRIVTVLDETIAVRDEEYRPLFLQGFLIDVSERDPGGKSLRLAG
jgi:PAS domain S-box-containing protein